MPSLVGCIGWLFLIVAPVTLFDRVLSFSILNWIYGILAAIGSVMVGFVLLAVSNSGPTTQEVTYYAYWCIAAGVLIIAARLLSLFGPRRATEEG
jgi:hypothetical protein